MAELGRRRFAPVLALYPLVLVVVLWEVAARAGLVAPLFLPSFSVVVVQAGNLLVAGDLFEPLWTSLFRAAAGFALATAGGITIGLLMGRVKWVHWLLDPLVALGFPAPKIAFIPIFILWFGIDDASKILLVAFTTIFPFIVAAYAGVRTVPVNQIWAARAMGETSEWGLLRRVILPAALPSLMSGVRVGVPVALLTTFTAEMVAGGGGLGGGEVMAERFFESPTVFAYLLVMLVVGYSIDVGVFAIRRRLLRWHEG
jgi:ABC-type nitrate/sulfonate/bicarbonate transport system permease component